MDVSLVFSIFVFTFIGSILFPKYHSFGTDGMFAVVSVSLMGAACSYHCTKYFRKQKASLHRKNLEMSGHFYELLKLLHTLIEDSVIHNKNYGDELSEKINEVCNTVKKLESGRKDLSVFFEENYAENQIERGEFLKKMDEFNIGVNNSLNRINNLTESASEFNQQYLQKINEYYIPFYKACQSGQESFIKLAQEKIIIIEKALFSVSESLIKENNSILTEQKNNNELFLSEVKDLLVGGVGGICSRLESLSNMVEKNLGDRIKDDLDSINSMKADFIEQLHEISEFIDNRNKLNHDCLKSIDEKYSAIFVGYNEGQEKLRTSVEEKINSGITLIEKFVKSNEATNQEYKSSNNEFLESFNDSKGKLLEALLKNVEEQKQILKRSFEDIGGIVSKMKEEIISQNEEQNEKNGKMILHFQKIQEEIRTLNEGDLEFLKSLQGSNNA
jgi:hypothetical protein